MRTIHYIMISLLYYTVMCTTLAWGREYKLLDVEKLDIEYLKLDPENRDPKAPQYTGSWGYRSSILWDVSIYHFLFWENRVHTASAGEGQSVKEVGWEYRAGIRIIPELDVLIYHHSQHLLDETTQIAQKFPVDNGYGFRIHFITGGK